jgi:autotransporter-associated beta strand protein
MTVTYGFYNSVNGDRKYDAVQMSKLFDGLIVDGIYSTIGTGFAVTAIASSMSVNVGIGRAWLDHTWTLNDATLAVTPDASEPALNRIDTVVIEVNSDPSVRQNSIKVIKGTPAGSPVAPTLSNTATLKQYPLANLYIAAGVTSLNAGNITNRIGVAGGTNYVSGLVSSIDFSVLWGRFESQFTAWFANLQNQLTTNQASNLQNQIDSLKLEDDGWIAAPGPWTYFNSTVVNAPSDVTLRYQKGYGVRFKQGGAYKYMYVTSMSATQIGLNGGSDFTVANAAITDIWYTTSPSDAFGFPTSFNYVVTPSNLTVTGTPTYTGRFTVKGGKIFIAILLNTTGTIASTLGTTTINVPINAATYGAIPATFYDLATGNCFMNSPSPLYLPGFSAHAGALAISGEYYW